MYLRSPTEGARYERTSVKLGARVDFARWRERRDVREGSCKTERTGGIGASEVRLTHARARPVFPPSPLSLPLLRGRRLDATPTTTATISVASSTTTSIIIISSSSIRPTVSSMRKLTSETSRDIFRSALIPFSAISTLPHLTFTPGFRYLAFLSHDFLSRFFFG